MARKIAIGTAALMAAWLWSADRPREQRYEQAVALFESKGDIPGAITLFEDAAKSADRSLASRALLYLGICYEKLGRAEAESAYSKVLQDFAEQPAAAQARARLASLKKLAGPFPNLVARKLDVPSRNFDFTTDGRRVVYRDYSSGQMIYGDLAGPARRVLLNFKPGDISWWAPSKDLSMVAVAFAAKPDRAAYISVVKTDGSAIRELVRNDEQGAGLDSVQWMNWSWDNRDLLVSVSDRDATGGYILVLSATDGKRRRLVDVQGGYAVNPRFSPDGRFVAYQILDARSAILLRTFVVPASGGKPSLIHEERRPLTYLDLLDWTADGRYLATTASAAAGPALHLFPVENGQAAGPPIVVRPGYFVAGNIWPSGALACWTVKEGGYAVHLAPLDADGKPGRWQPLDFGGYPPMSPYVIDWSPDANQIVYVAANLDAGQSGGAVVRIRNLATGQDREIHRSTARVGCIWNSASKLLCGGPSADGAPAGQMAMFSIDVDSGAREPLRPFPGMVMYGQASRDGRFVYACKGGISAAASEFVRWEIETGREMLLERASETDFFRVSPDARWLVRSANLKLAVRPLAGGDWKPLATINRAAADGSGFRQFAVTPDSKWLVYCDVDPAGKHGLFRIPIAGGPSERLGDFISLTGPLGTLDFSPDGRRLLSGVVSQEQRELWLLRNFVPVTHN